MAIEDYFKGSSQAYGQLAGSLLAGRRNEDKKQAKRALLASTVMATFGALQNKQKQSIIDGANDVKEKYSDIFRQNKSEFESYDDDRALLKRYNDNPETFLNEEVTKIIDNTDEAKEAGVTFGNREKESKELRELLESSYNEEKEKLEKRMLALKADKRITTRTFEQFNQKATDEFKAALALVEDDPTKKGLIKAAWNRIFKTERNDEGELVTKNVELLDLQAALKNAKDNRTSFRDSIENQIVEEHIYKPLQFRPKPKNLSKIYTTVIPNLTKLVSNQSAFTNVEPLFFKEVIDNIIKEEPNLSLEQINEKSYTAILNNEVDPEDYLNRRGVRVANGVGLIKVFEEFETSEERDNFIKERPEKLGQLVDAYKREDRATDGNLLLTEYKDVYATNKEYIPSSLQIQANVDRIRTKINPRVNKELLADTTTLGVLGNNVSYTENYYKKNNPDWDKTYTEVELKDLAVRFIMDNYKNKDSLNVRMTNADLLVDTLGVNGEKLTEEILDKIPSMIKELQDVKREKEIVDLRDVLNTAVEKNKTLEFDEDEKEEFKQEINSNFKDFDLDSYESINSNLEDIEEGLSLEEKIQARISDLPEQTPFGSFLSGGSRERNIISQESMGKKQKEIKTFIEKKNIIRSKLRNIEKDKTTKINRNLFTRPSEKETKEMKDKNARRVSDILQSKYGLSTNISNAQKLNNKLNILLKDSPETYDEIIDILSTYEY